MTDLDHTHLVVCKNKEALEHLIKEVTLIGAISKKGRTMSQGDALVAKEILEDGGFVWGEDFYLKKV